MNKSTFTAWINSILFESNDIVKFVILSPKFCHKKDLRQTLDISPAVPLDFCILPIHFILIRKVCAFLITFPRIKFLVFRILKNVLYFCRFFQFLDLEIFSSLYSCHRSLGCSLDPSCSFVCAFLITFSRTQIFSFSIYVNFRRLSSFWT